MEILFLIVYSLLAWLIFFKFRLLPWNIVSQVITITIPLVLLTIVILLLNIGAPSSGDVRAINYSVQIVPRVTGRVVEVAAQPNRPVKRGDVLFRIDPVPFQLALQQAKANLAQSEAKLIGSQANQRTYVEQLKEAQSKRKAIEPKLQLAQTRVRQYTELLRTGAGSRFDLEQAESEVQALRSDLAAVAASEAQAREKTQARTKNGEQDEVARVKAEMEAAKAQIAQAQWDLDQTTVYAPSDGTIVNLQLRVGHVASQLVQAPVMTLIEEGQWVVATYAQNEVREVKPGQEAEIALRMYPGRIIKCKVDSVVWATGGGQVPITGNLVNAAPLPPGKLLVRLFPDDHDLFIAAGALGQGAVYTDYAPIFHIIRRVFIRVQAKLDWLVLKLH
jgi:multidrug resistance efflux pump